MSDFEPGRLYLLTTGDDTFQVVLDLSGLRWLTLDGFASWPVNASDVTVRPAIVLDPQDEDVREFLEGWPSDVSAYTTKSGSWAPAPTRLATQMRAQITPSKPVMAEPVSEALGEPDGLIAITFRKTPKMWHEIANILDTSVHSHVGDTIRTAVPAPMAEPTEWGAKATDDRGDWLLADEGTDEDPIWLKHGRANVWSSWSAMVNPRPYEGVRDGE